MNKSITQQIDEQQKRCRWCGKPVSIFHMFCNDKCRKDYDSQKEYFKKKGLCYECGLPVTKTKLKQILETTWMVRFYRWLFK